jgi:hypothetical protein
VTAKSCIDLKGKTMNFLNRIKEPSTWAGLASLAVLLGANPETTSQVVNAGGSVAHAVGAVAGLMAIFMREKAK